jgi:hypothetical protein
LPSVPATPFDDCGLDRALLLLLRARALRGAERLAVRRAVLRAAVPPLLRFVLRVPPARRVVACAISAPFRIFPIPAFA